jgi:hypothetical protein
MTIKLLSMELIDRRAFLGGAGLIAGAVVATTLAPLSMVHASATGLSFVTAGEAGTWHIDDVCGHWPPYAHPIGYGHGSASVTVAHAEPIDHIFLV